jgi:hypothetical protein
VQGKGFSSIIVFIRVVLEANAAGDAFDMQSDMPLISLTMQRESRSSRVVRDIDTVALQQLLRDHHIGSTLCPCGVLRVDASLSARFVPAPLGELNELTLKKT